MLAIVIAYALLTLGAALSVAIRLKRIRLVALMPVVFLSLHVPYGLGSLAALADATWDTVRHLGRSRRS